MPGGTFPPSEAAPSPPPPIYLYTQIPLLPVINKWGEGGESPSGHALSYILIFIYKYIIYIIDAMSRRLMETKKKKRSSGEGPMQ